MNRIILIFISIFSFNANAIQTIYTSFCERDDIRAEIQQAKNNCSFDMEFTFACSNGDGDTPAEYSTGCNEYSDDVSAADYDKYSYRELVDANFYNKANGLMNHNINNNIVKANDSIVRSKYYLGRKLSDVEDSNVDIKRENSRGFDKLGDELETSNEELSRIRGLRYLSLNQGVENNDLLGSIDANTVAGFNSLNDLLRENLDDNFNPPDDNSGNSGNDFQNVENSLDELNDNFDLSKTDGLTIPEQEFAFDDDDLAQLKSDITTSEELLTKTITDGFKVLNDSFSVSVSNDGTSVDLGFNLSIDGHSLNVPNPLVSWSKYYNDIGMVIMMLAAMSAVVIVCSKN